MRAGTSFKTRDSMSKLTHMQQGAFGKVIVVDLSKGLVAHAHSECHMVFWLDGAENHHLRVSGINTPLNKYCGTVINSWQPHTHLVQDRPATFLAFYIEHDWLRSTAYIDPAEAWFNSNSVRLSDELSHEIGLFKSMLASSGGIENADERIAQFFEMTQAAIRQRRRSHTATIKTMTEQNVRLSESISYMKENMSLRASIDEVARVCGMSRPRFFNLFREQLQTTPNVYWNMLRMESAIQQMTRSDISVADLSEQLGFSQPGNFSRFFRDRAGVSPSDYRMATIRD